MSININDYVNANGAVCAINSITFYLRQGTDYKQRQKDILSGENSLPYIYNKKLLEVVNHILVNSVCDINYLKRVVNQVMQMYPLYKEHHNCNTFIRNEINESLVSIQDLQNIIIEYIKCKGETI